MNALVDAWQAVLAAEQRAAFGYATLGPRLPAARSPSARADQARHEATRDTVAGRIAALGATPDPPPGDYPDLYDRLDSPALLAASLEDDCAVAWRYLFATATSTATPAAVRRQALAGLTTSAVRATAWRVAGGSVRPVSPFPGT